jgi:DNA-binding MarR family transcriptional regulator
MDIVSNHGLSIVEVFLMSVVYENALDSTNNVTMKEIRENLFATKAAVSQTLNALEKKGYIARDVDKNNRRNIIVTLTPEGRSALHDCTELFHTKLDMFIENLGKENAKQVMALTEKMIEAMEACNANLEQ